MSQGSSVRHALAASEMCQSAPNFDPFERPVHYAMRPWRARQLIGLGEPTLPRKVQL
jgi:hypothetical protein